MTIATDLGFKIGELYRVDKGNHFKGTILKFVSDDGTACPLFKYEDGDIVYARLENLVPTEQPNTTSNKPILLLYIQQQYPDDRVLKALVESL